MIRAEVPGCGCSVVATSEQYVEIELALHVCIPEDETDEDACYGCRVCVPHPVCQNRRTA